MKRAKAYKKLPAYWWDMQGDSIIVESDAKRTPVARFPFDPNGGEEATGAARHMLIECKLPTRVGQAANAIKQAEAYIADLIAGRRKPSAEKV